MDEFERTKRIDAIKAAEAKGRVADNMEFRTKLVKAFEAGEITFDEMQAAVVKAKRDAKRNGQITRNQAFKGR